MIDIERERQRHRQREKQALCREPDAGLDPRTPGSCPGPKAGAKPLSHPGIPLRPSFESQLGHFFPGGPGQFGLLLRASVFTSEKWGWLSFLPWLWQRENEICNASCY